MLSRRLLKAAADAKDAAPAATMVWPEGATVAGRVLDHRGVPIANAEVLLLGKERIIVDADRRTWFVPEREDPAPRPHGRTRLGPLPSRENRGPRIAWR